jgi:MYXO-CTERM domain-containing protein
LGEDRIAMRTLLTQLGFRRRVTAALCTASTVVAVLAGEGRAAAVPAVRATPAQTVLAFNPAAVGVSAGSAQQLTATFTVTGLAVPPTASLHYGLSYSAGPINCVSGSSGQTCTVNVTFIPTLPGGRKDALVLSNAGTVLATVLLYGVGQSPLALIQPGVITQVISDYTTYLYESAVGEDGTVYALAHLSNAVVQLSPAGAATQLPVTLSGPQGIAIDGAGTLYIAHNAYGDAVTTYSAGGVQGQIPVVPPSPYVPCSNSNGGTLEYLDAVAVDGLGDLFTTEILCQQIFELTSGGAYVTTAIAPAITQPSTMTVDSAGNVFVGGYTINEWTVGGVQSQINMGGAVGQVSTDAAGTVYATRYTGLGGVAVLPAAGFGTPLATVDTNVSPLGASVAPDGTVYVGNYTDLDRVDRSQGAVSFGEQSAGVTSSAQTVSLYNGGNESLTLSAVSLTDTDFAWRPSEASGCSVGTVVSPGALCNIDVTLTPPHAGTYAGTLKLTSNSLNATTQLNVALSGFVYGVFVVPTPDPLDFGAPLPDAGPVTLPVTLMNEGDLYSAGIGTPASDNPAFTPALGTCTSGLAVGSTCQLDVTFTAGDAGAYAGTVTLMASSTGGGPDQTISFAVEAHEDTTPDAGAGTPEASVNEAGSQNLPDGAAPIDATIVVDASAEVDAAAVDAPITSASADASAPVDAGVDAPTSGVTTSAADAGADAPTTPIDAAIAVDAAAATSLDGGQLSVPPVAESQDCSCRTVGGSRGAPWAWPLALALVAVRFRRRKAAYVSPSRDGEAQRY